MKILLPLLLLVSISLSAQNNDAVMGPIYQLFEGMKKGDSAMAHRAFVSNPTMYRVTLDKQNQPALRKDELSGFLKQIGTPHKDVFNEVIWDPKIEVDGNLAQVWVQFGFFVNTTFHHCGVDVFNLVKTPQGDWKIFYLADTNRKDNCNVPKELTDKLK